MSARRYTVEDWRRAVYQHPGISDGTRVLLLLLSEYMRADLSVSVPRPTLVKRLGQSHREATFTRRLDDRFREAVGEKPEADPVKAQWNYEHRLLDRKVRGQKHVTSVYAGLVPMLSTTPDSVLRTVAKRRAENGDTGSQHDVSERAITRAQLSDPTTVRTGTARLSVVSPTNAGSDERSAS